MIGKSILSLPAHEFARLLERALTPTLTDCFSEDTKKLRNLVLLFGFLLILLALGILSIDRKPVELPLIKLTVTVTRGLTGVLITLCSFFTVIFAARSYSEWHLWRLKHAAPLLELEDLNKQISAAQLEISHRLASIIQRASALRKNGASTADKEEVIQRIIDETQQDETAQLMAMQVTLLELLVPTKRTLMFRFWLEAVFPVAFGSVAILWAAFTP